MIGTFGPWWFVEYSEGYRKIISLVINHFIPVVDVKEETQLWM